MLLAYSDSAHAARCVRYFRRLGWEVHMVASGALAQRLANELAPQAVVLDADLPDESGWLSAAKIGLLPPEHRIVLLADRADEQSLERTRSLGIAGLVARDEGPEAVAALIAGRQLSVAV